MREAATSRNDAAENDAAKRRAIDQQSTLINDLQAQLVKAKERFNNLSQNAVEYDKAAQHILESLKQWARRVDAIKELTDDFSKKQDSNAIDPRFAPLVELDLLQRAVIQYCETQRKAAMMLSDGNLNGPSQAVRRLSALGNILDHTRRVMVQSPSWNVPSPKPPSIEIEQERRRAAEPPKSIMKPPQQHIEDPPNEFDTSNFRNESRGTQQPAIAFTRGPYNRPVAGSNTRISISEEDRSMLGKDKKRKEPAGTEVAAPKKKARPTLKRDESILSTPRVSQAVVDHEVAIQEAPGAPRKAENAGMTCKEDESNSPVRSSQGSQDGSQLNGRSSLKGQLTPRIGQKPPTGSQDPLLLFYARRGSTRANDDSQTSTARSQDVDSLPASQSLLSRFTMGR